MPRRSLIRCWEGSWTRSQKYQKSEVRNQKSPNSSSELETLKARNGRMRRPVSQSANREAVISIQYQLHAKKFSFYSDSSCLAYCDAAACCVHDDGCRAVVTCNDL